MIFNYLIGVNKKEEKRLALVIPLEEDISGWNIEFGLMIGFEYVRDMTKADL